MTLSPKFSEALVLTHRLHAQQTRKSNPPIPYIMHLLGVCSIVLEYGGSEEEAIAGLLHDAVEDQGGQPTEDVIRRCFGDKVADIVRGCTDADTIPKPPWRARKEKYIAHLAETDASTRLVSAADKLHNARAILSDYRQVGEKVWERFTGGREGTLWYYRALVTAFRSFGTSPLIEELDRTVCEIERLAKK
jgi:(p)ppGpp synthase/HD superfamily hydrolase